MIYHTLFVIFEKSSKILNSQIIGGTLWLRVSSIMTQNSHFLLSDDEDSVSFLILPVKTQKYVYL